MPFEAKVIRHCTVTVAKVAIPGFIAARPRQRPQTQQRDVVQDEAGIDWYGSQSVHRGLRLVEVAITFVLQQSFDQGRSGQCGPDGSARFVQAVERHPCQLDGAVDIAGYGSLPREVYIGDRQGQR